MFETRTNPKGKTKVFDKKGNLTIHGKKVEKALVDMIKVDEGKIVSMGVDFDLDDDENVDGGYKRRKTKRKLSTKSSLRASQNNSKPEKPQVTKELNETIKEKLILLKQLFDQGLINEEEYNKKKKEVMKRF